MRLFLWINAIGWIGYGVFCLFFQPQFQALAQLQPVSSSGAVELRAMYGGLESAVGVFLLLCLLRSRGLETATLALLCVFAGLGITRLSAAVVAGDDSAYTVGAAAFELVFAGIALGLLRRPAHT